MLHLTREEILTYLQTAYTQDHYTGFNGCRLRYIVSKKQSSSAVVVLGGRTEFIEKYGEFLYDLEDLDCSFYSYDHRGQGLSDRFLEDGRKGYVADFQEYVEDLKIFLEEIVAPHKHDKTVIISHSMGGTIAVRFEQQYPGILDGLILSSPMFSIETAPVPRLIAAFVISCLVRLGFGTRYIFGRKHYEASEMYEGNKVTSSRERFLLNREFVETTPDLVLGGPTNSWVWEAFKATAETLAGAGQGTIPILLLQSGADQVVAAAAQQQFCEKRTNCQMHTVPGALHELLMEEDCYRDKALSLIRSFIKNLGNELSF